MPQVSLLDARSPFRYPGGKTWLVPTIRQWFANLPNTIVEIIEPFAGGGVTSLTAVFENLTQRATLAELDNNVAAVWETIFNGHAHWLSERITTFELTNTAVQEVLQNEATSQHELAFQTIVRNRTNHGGKLADGAGSLRRGENGRGLRSRWYPETLARRIINIYNLRDRFHFIHGDGIEILRANADRNDVVFFVDPPYTVAGKRPGTRLYAHNELDHDALFERMAQVRGDFLMTYDDEVGVRNLAERFGFDLYPIEMRNTHNNTVYELLIGRDLEWARRGIRI